MEFTALNVSTMTCSAAVAVLVALDLDAVFDAVDVDVDGGLAGVINQERTTSRPHGLKLGNRFGTNVTMHVKVPGNLSKNINIKLFSNGCLQLTGAKTAADGLVACGVVADKLHAKGFILDATFFDFRVRMINSDMRASQCINRAYLYEKWRQEPLSCIVFDPLTYPALKLLQFFDATAPLDGQDGLCRCSKHCSTKSNAKHRRCAKVTAALFESGCIIITGSIMPAGAEVVRRRVIERLLLEGARAYIVKEDPKVIMKRLLDRHRALKAKAQ
jgi:hypothetical protein